MVSGTVAHVRNEARARGLADTVDRTLVAACQEPSQPSRKTVLSNAMVAAAPVAALRRA